MVLKQNCHSAFRRERLQPRYSGVVERFDHSDHEIHSAVEVGAVDDSIMSMRSADRNENGGHGYNDIVELDGACVVTETRNEIELQRDVLGCGDFLLPVRARQLHSIAPANPSHGTEVFVTVDLRT
jgi:hypothetical protein